MDVNTRLQQMYDRRDAIVNMSRSNTQRRSNVNDEIYREDLYRLQAITLLRPFFDDLLTTIDYVTNLGTEFVTIEEYVGLITDSEGQVKTSVVLCDLRTQGIER